MPDSIDRNAQFRESVLQFARRDPEGMTDMYVRLRQELTQPPPGWFNFGTHILPEHRGVRLDWWGTGDDGMPIWERPAQEEQ